MRHAIRICTTLVVTMLFVITLGVANAKGGVSYLKGATLSGGELPAPVHTSISIPDQNW